MFGLGFGFLGDWLQSRRTRRETELIESQIRLEQLRHSKAILESIKDDGMAKGQEDRLNDRLKESLTSDNAEFNGMDLYLKARYSDDTGNRWVPIQSPSDRRAGANWPLYRTDTELSQLRMASRILAQTNAYAIGLTKNLRNYTIEAGGVYKVMPKVKSPPPLIQRLCDMAQRVVDRFLSLNHWNSVVSWDSTLTISATREQECYTRIPIDGEAFIRFFFRPNGDTIVRFIEPELVWNRIANEKDGWSFGIQHQMEPFEDVETIVNYCITVSRTGAYEIVPASQILHLKGTYTPSTVKRGMPHFSYDTLNALERAAKLQRNVSSGAAIRSAIAMIWQYQRGTSSQIGSIAQQFQESAYSDPVTGQTRTTERIPPASIVRVGAGQEIATPPSERGNMIGWIEGVQGDLRQGGTASCSPEYWTGNAENQNYASIREAGAPAVRNGRVEQAYFQMAFKRAVWQAINWAVRCRQLPEEVLQYCDLQVDLPDLIHREPIDKARADDIQIKNGTLSPQTSIRENGRDPEEEAKNIVEWQQEMGGGGQGQPEPPSNGEGGGEVSDGESEGLGDDRFSSGPPTAAEGDEEEDEGDNEDEEEGNILPFDSGITESLTEAEKWEWEWGEYKRMQEAESYFKTCERDDKGHCKSEGGSKEQTKIGDRRKKDEDDEEDDAKKWDGVTVDQSEVSRGSWRETEALTTWTFRDNDGTEWDQEVILEKGYLTTPDPNADEVPVWRWVSSQNGWATDQGDWVLDKEEAREEGLNYASENDDPAVSREEDIYDPERYKEAREVFDDLDDDFTLSVLGIDDGHVQEKSRVKKHETEYSDEEDLDAYGIEVNISHPKLSSCTRFFGIDADGNKFIKNELLVVKPMYRGEGLGTSIFASQVEQASKSGFSYIQTHAAGDKESTMNGYYTWPRLGYDQDLEDLRRYEDSVSVYESAREKFPESRTVLDIMESPGGREWWKENGIDLRNARFDLREGSRSRQILASYLKEKGKSS